MQVQHGADVVLGGVQDFFVVGVDQKGQRRASQAGRRLDDAWPNVLPGLLVEQGQALAAVLFVLPQIPTGVVGAFAAIGNAFELAPAFPEREAILDVDGPF